MPQTEVENGHLNPSVLFVIFHPAYTNNLLLIQKCALLLQHGNSIVLM